MSSSDDAREYNAWAARFLWPTRLPPLCPVLGMDAASTDCEAWVRELQTRHGLRVDGRLGPSTLYACMALYGGGERPGSLGGLIVAGQEHDLGVPVVRFFEPGAAPRLAEPPRLGMLLSVNDLERDAGRRSRGELARRSHFTIESGQGADGHGLILQWADPLDDLGDELGIARADEREPGTWLPDRRALGLELENPLVLHERNHEQRTRRRTREVAVAEINGRRAKQLAFYPEQLATLDRLLALLERELGIPRRFPIDDATGDYDTSTRPLADWADWQGWLARFHVADRLGEPGMGLAVELERLFGALERREPEPVPVASELGDDERQSRRPPAWMVEQGWFAEDASGNWRATEACPPRFRPSAPTRREVESRLPPAMRSSGSDHSARVASEPAPTPVSTSPADRSALDEAWQAPAPSALEPPPAVESSFSLARALQDRPGGRRRRNRRSRAESMRTRLLRGAGDDE